MKLLNKSLFFVAIIVLSFNASAKLDAGNVQQDSIHNSGLSGIEQVLTHLEQDSSFSEEVAGDPITGPFTPAENMWLKECNAGKLNTPGGCLRKIIDDRRMLLGANPDQESINVAAISEHSFDYLFRSSKGRLVSPDEMKLKIQLLGVKGHSLSSGQLRVLENAGLGKSR